jgi:hypothetical protein
MLRKITTALALMTLAGTVYASGSARRGNELYTSRPTEQSELVVRAPEVDPASAMAAFTLLAGGLAVLRGRRAEK